MEEKTQIIIYEESSKKIEAFSKTRIDFLYFKKLRTSYSWDNLLRILSKDGSPQALFFVSRMWTETDKKRLYFLTKEFPKISIMVCADGIHSLEAWKYDLLNFLEIPVRQKKINDALRKYLFVLNKNREKAIVINYNGARHMLYPSSVLYCKAEQNYSEIHTMGKDKITVIYQIGKLAGIFEKTLQMKRVGRSYLINFANIESIGKGQINFISKKNVELKLSDNYIRKVKEILADINE